MQPDLHSAKRDTIDTLLSINRPHIDVVVQRWFYASNQQVRQL